MFWEIPHKEYPTSWGEVQRAAWVGMPHEAKRMMIRREMNLPVAPEKFYSPHLVLDWLVSDDIEARALPTEPKQERQRARRSDNAAEGGERRARRRRDEAAEAQAAPVQDSASPSAQPAQPAPPATPPPAVSVPRPEGAQA